MWAFLLGSELYYWKKNDWYLYKFYPIDFFDRNFLVILIYLNLAVFFSDIFNRRRFFKEIKEIMGESAIVTDR